MPFTIIRNDITKLRVDAIVNAANTDLAMGGGVCGAIFKAAGATQLQVACDKLAPIRTGEAVVTSGFGLTAKFVIHAAGPVYRHWNAAQNEELLRAAYTNSLKRAVENKCESVAFPLISSGIYGYPKDEALRVATSAIRDFISEHTPLGTGDIDVSLVVFDKAAFAISEELLGKVASYIDEHYAEEHHVSRRELLDVERDALSDAEMVSYTQAMPQMREVTGAPPQNIQNTVDNLDEPFSSTLLRLIDKSGKKDSEIYNRANIDRRLFSKIRSNAHYTPSKQTVIAFAIALELSLDQTEDLLKRAGFALSHSRKFDVIVEYFIASGNYGVYEINEVLFSYDQALLGG
ncbi:MAG: macro domain-containing protein [Clostridiales Family XIII bacterium]|jgi:O-acetyl-ADP-ribose deacetylase (regulator of RNase III)|nr:macro domain-containing protein [Clostridiales Family XIII bacterium]